VSPRKKCEHRKVGMRRMPNDGWRVECKACRLLGATAHPSIEGAYLHRREDFRDAEAERDAAAALAAPVLSDAEAERRAQRAQKVALDAMDRVVTG
jgi:hypothetical protein